MLFIDNPNKYLISLEVTRHTQCIYIIQTIVNLHTSFIISFTLSNIQADMLFFQLFNTANMLKKEHGTKK